MGRNPNKTRADQTRERHIRQGSLLDRFKRLRTIGGPELQRIYCVSQSTLIRDIRVLRRLGHDIRGEQGVGYMYVPPKTKDS